MTVVDFSDKNRVKGEQPVNAAEIRGTQQRATGFVNPVKDSHLLNQPSTDDRPSELQTKNSRSTDDSRESLIERWDRKVRALKPKKPLRAALKSDWRARELAPRSSIGNFRVSTPPSSKSLQGISFFGTSAKLNTTARSEWPVVADTGLERQSLSGKPSSIEANSAVDEVAKLLVAEALRPASDRPVNSSSPLSPSNTSPSAPLGTNPANVDKADRQFSATERAAAEIHAWRQTGETDETVRRPGMLGKTIKSSKTRLTLGEEYSPPHRKVSSSRQRKTRVREGRKAGVINNSARWRTLIVLISIGLLGLVVSTFFERSVDDAKTAAAESSVNIIRAAISSYYTDHEVLPGVHASAGGTCVSDVVGGSGSAGSSRSFVEQLTQFTNQLGQTCSQPGGAYVHGPYLRSTTLPNEPFSLSNNLTILAGTDVAAGVSQMSTKGWTYILDTGEFRPSRRQVTPE